MTEREKKILNKVHYLLLDLNRWRQERTTCHFAASTKYNGHIVKILIDELTLDDAILTVMLKTEDDFIIGRPIHYHLHSTPLLAAVKDLYNDYYPHERIG